VPAPPEPPRPGPGPSPAASLLGPPPPLLRQQLPVLRRPLRAPTWPPRLRPARPPPRHRRRRARPVVRHRGRPWIDVHPLAPPWRRPPPDDRARPNRARAHEEADRRKRRRRPQSRRAAPPAGLGTARVPRPAAAVAHRSAPAPAGPSRPRPEDLRDRPPAARSPRRRAWVVGARPAGPAHLPAAAVPAVAAVRPGGPAPAVRAGTEVPALAAATEAAVPAVGWDAGRCRRLRLDEADQAVGAVPRSAGLDAAGATWRSSSPPS